MQISGLTIIRNALTNGYPIAEVIDNLALISDEVIVCDGHSTDGTAEYLQTRTDITLYQDRWNLQSRNGLEFANITNCGLERCNGDYVFYLQADEIMHPSDLLKLQELIRTGKYNAIFCDFHHIRYDFDYALNAGYKSAIRAIRNKCGISSAYDGYSFLGNIDPCFQSDVVIYHFGYVFLRNIFRKMINHADCFYHEAKNYHRRKELALDFLAKLDAGETLEPLEVQRALEPEYALVPHHTVIPACMERLRGAVAYTLPEKTEWHSFPVSYSQKWL